MTRRPAQQRAAIDRLYAELPDVECKGSCADSCTRIDMTRVERRRIAAAGVDIPVAGDGREALTAVRQGFRCPALTALNRCSVYTIRPAICRLWGLTAAMQCSYGCVPVGGYMTDRDAFLWLARVAEAAGEPAQAARHRQVADLPDLTRLIWREFRDGMAQLREPRARWNRGA